MNLVVLVVLAMLLVMSRRRRRPTFGTSTMTSRVSSTVALLDDGSGNESLVVDGSVGGVRALFMIDTAYAGAPVLSTSFLKVDVGGGPLEAAYRRATSALAHTSSDGRRAVREFVEAARCRSFTSGCTMRLMGIGETSEMQADMLVCPGLRVAGAQTMDVDADVFVTHPLPGTIHILTIDYLLHRSPCVIRPASGGLAFGSDDSEGFHRFASKFVGGAFVVPVEVAGRTLSIVVDTGASAPLSLAPRAIDKLRKDRVRCTSEHVRQTGVNGERVCSDVFRARVRVGPHDVGELSILANSHDVQGADGYMGMGILRAFDLWLEREWIGFRPSGLEARSVNPRSVSKGGCAVRRGMCSR